MILKYLLLFSLLGFGPSLHAKQYTSVNNGKWSEVSTWNPFGFPLPSDTVTINTNVILDADWGVTVGGMITINLGAMLTEDIPGRVFLQANGTIINNGTFNVSYFWLGGGQLTNNDSARFDRNLFVDSNGIFVNAGVIADVDSLWNNGVFSNSTPTSEVFGAVFYNADSVYNDGGFAYLEGLNQGILYNEGTMAGQTFVNDGEIVNGLNGSFNVAGFWNNWKFDNASSARLNVSRDFLNGDSLAPISGPRIYNDGAVNVGRHFYNADSLVGVSGRYCIGGNSYNWGYVGGSVDVCDNSGTVSFDQNWGTIEPTVTYCSSACGMVVSVDWNDPSCDGGTDGNITFSVYGGTNTYTYTWNNGNSTNASTNLSEGAYVVVVSDGVDTNFVLIVLQTDPISVLAATTESFCDKENGTAEVTAFGGTTPYTYLWNDVNAQSNAMATSLGAGSYSVTITDINGCIITDLLMVTSKPGITVNTNLTDVLCESDSNGIIDLTVTGGTPDYKYSWVPDVSTGPVAADVKSGDYTITIIDADSCAVINTVTVAVSGGADCVKELDWKIFSGITPNGDGIDDVWEIQGLSQFKPVTVDIFTNRGIVIWSSDDYNNDWDGTDQDGNLLMPGVYYYVVTKSGEADKGWVHIKR